MQLSNLVVDAVPQVNLPSMTGNTHCTAVLNRAKIQAPIFPTDSIKCTNGVDRTEIVKLVSTPIIEHNTEETVIPCIDSNIENIESVYFWGIRKCTF